MPEAALDHLPAPPPPPPQPPPHNPSPFHSGWLRFPGGRYHGGRRPSSDDSFHSPTVIPPSALDKPSIMKRCLRRRTTRWGVTARSPTMVTLYDTRFVECRWWNDGWTVKTVVTWRSSASVIPAPGVKLMIRWSWYHIKAGKFTASKMPMACGVAL